MVTLMDILREYGNNPKEAERIASDMFKPWKSSPETPLESIKTQLRISGYRIIDSMDYGNMKELPANPHFDFDPTGESFERYFGITSLERKIEVPYQPSKDSVTIGLGISPIESMAYVLMAFNGTIDRIKAVKGNEPINIPILYASIKGHIQIILPNSLVYSV